MRYVLAAALILIGVALAPVQSLAISIKSEEANIDLTTEKVAHVGARIDATSLSNFVGEMLSTALIPGPRVIYINSLGGIAEAGEDMIRLMEVEKYLGVQQICVVQEADSMAFNLLTHCSVRLALPRASFMMHKIARTGVDCATERCTSKRLRAVAAELDTLDAPYRAANAKALKMKLAEYDLYADRDHEWSVEDLIKRGYIHGYCATRK